MIVSLTLGPGVTAGLVELGWLPETACRDKGALTHALANLIERTMAMRVTPTRLEGVHFMPLRATAGPIRAESHECDRLSPPRDTPAEQASPQRVGAGHVELDEILDPADGAGEVADDTTRAARPRATPTQPFVVDPVKFWAPRLDLYLNRRMWLPDWGPRPDQVGCAAPGWLLDEYRIQPSGYLQSKFASAGLCGAHPDRPSTPLARGGPSLGDRAVAKYRARF